MRQRAALLRTVVQEREVLLLDEPFGALDSLTRTEMQTWLQDVRARYGWTVLMITHDIREAVFLADRVVVLSARPARVCRQVEVSLPRPRTLSMVTAPEFARGGAAVDRGAARAVAACPGSRSTGATGGAPKLTGARPAWGGRAPVVLAAV